jgi:hypothetical protein
MYITTIACTSYYSTLACTVDVLPSTIKAVHNVMLCTAKMHVLQYSLVSQL